MCDWKSGEVVLADGVISVSTLEGNDSHTEIRKACGIPEDRGPGTMGGQHAPAELIPVRGCGPITEWEFRWDDGARPEWATPEIEARAADLLWQAAQRDMMLEVWPGNLCVSGTATLPALRVVGGKRGKWTGNKDRKSVV